MGMRRERQCVGWPPEMGCDRPHCRNWNAKIWFCDQCGAEESNPENLFVYDNNVHPEWRELCEDCYVDRMLIDAERVEDREE